MMLRAQFGQLGQLKMRA